MKQTLTVSLLIIIFAISACSPLATATPTPLPTTKPTAFVATQIPTPLAPTKTNPPATHKSYTSDAFGLSFQYPANWFGPSEYVSDTTLRVEIGSDKVYPYGERPDQPSSVKNSYHVVIQYTKNNHNSFWKDIYQPLQNLKDGESLSGARSLLIRVRQLNVGRFAGFEYITTLSQTAQTERVYSRSVMLLDKQTNDLLTIMGQPDNVEVINAASWREVYRSLDEANQPTFQKIIESLVIK